MRLRLRASIRPRISRRYACAWALAEESRALLRSVSGRRGVLCDRGIDGDARGERKRHGRLSGDFQKSQRLLVGERLGEGETPLDVRLAAVRGGCIAQSHGDFAEF